MNGHLQLAEGPAPYRATAPEQWRFQLYVAGMSRSAHTALANLRAICETHLPDRHAVEIVDLHEQPERAEADRVLAVPMLVRVHPGPARRIVGDLTTTEQVLAGLEIPPQP